MFHLSSKEHHVKMGKDVFIFWFWYGKKFKVDSIQPFFFFLFCFCFRVGLGGKGKEWVQQSNVGFDCVQSFTLNSHKPF